jgi:hypothetical protein
MFYNFKVVVLILSLVSASSTSVSENAHNVLNNESDLSTSSLQKANEINIQAQSNGGTGMFSFLSDLVNGMFIDSEKSTVRIRADQPVPEFHNLQDMLYSTEFKELLSMPDSMEITKPKFHAAPKDLQTREKCFMVSLDDDTPPHIVEKIKEILTSPFMQGNLTGIFEKVMKGLTVCFDSDNAANDYKFPYWETFEKIPWINIVERDNRIAAFQVQKDAPWGLSRISKPDLPVNYKYAFDQIAKDVCVYVLDSGVKADHPEFGGRVDPVYSSFGDPKNSGIDLSGHGTEVASILAGTNLGVAKGALIKSVQVLDSDGGGRNSDLVNGLEWIATHLQMPAVINLSLGGPKSAILDRVVTKILKMNIPIVVAAGNYKKNACTMSPCNIPRCITVGATNDQDARAPYSNYGSCVDIFAPGSSMMVATSGEKSTSNRPSVRGYSIASGTSLAAPMVSGVIALLLQNNNSMTGDDAWKELERLAAKGVLREDTLNHSPNLLLQIPPITEPPGSERLVTFSTNMPNPRIFDPDKNETWTAISPDINESSLDGKWSMSTTTWIVIGASLGGALLLAIGLFFWIRSMLGNRNNQNRNDASTNGFTSDSSKQVASRSNMAGSPPVASSNTTEYLPASRVLRQV